MIELVVLLEKSNNWLVEKAMNASRTEYKNSVLDKLPTEYLEFLSAIKSVTTTDDKTWFLSIDDYEARSDSEFNWNEFELQSLEVSDGDDDFCSQVKAFWNSHIPILLSVRDRYSYVAYNIDDKSVYFGEEPEYEDSVVKIANSITEFIKESVIVENGNKNEFPWHNLS